MKKALIFIFLVISFHVSAQKVIQMEKQNGVYKISCSINGAKMKLVFDTGASMVSISQSMAIFLYENDYISDSDILGKGTSRTADGSIVDNVIINLRDIEISGLHLKNVQATVISSQNAPLLLGQSAIQKLGRISLDGDKLIINDYEGDYSEEEIDKIISLAVDYYENENYNASINNWLKIIDYTELSTMGYSVLIECLFRTEQYDKIIEYGKEWERKYRNEKPTLESARILVFLACALGSTNNSREAIIYLEKLIRIDNQLGRDSGSDYISLSLEYYSLEEWDMVIKYSKMALECLFSKYKTSENIISSKGINNDEIGRCLYFYSMALYQKNNISDGNYIMILSANCNYEDAIKYCYQHNINFKRRSLFD